MGCERLAEKLIEVWVGATISNEAFNWRQMVTEGLVLLDWGFNAAERLNPMQIQIETPTNKYQTNIDKYQTNIDKYQTNIDKYQTNIKQLLTNTRQILTNNDNIQTNIGK